MHLITKSKIEWLQPRGYAINPFLGCAYACYEGCWAYLNAKRHGWVKDWEEWQRPKINPKFQGIAIAASVQQEVLRLPPDAQILLSATTDPFQPDYFGYYSIVEKILRGVSNAGRRPWILTKSGSGIVRFLPWLEDCRAKVGITLTSLEETKWEPHAEEPYLRLLALQKAKEAGLSTYISIEPIIPEFTDPKAIIKASKDFTDCYILGSFNYVGVSKRYYREMLPSLLKWLEEERINFFLKRELRDLKSKGQIEGV